MCGNFLSGTSQNVQIYVGITTIVYTLNIDIKINIFVFHIL